MLDTFYSTVAQLCFALLGLWWVVVQFKHEEWMNRPGKRRMAYSISLYFILPGLMCLISLLAADAKILWRLGFGIAGALGAVESAYMIVRGDASAAPSGWLGLARWVVVLLYVLIVVLAIAPQLGQLVGLQALEVEGILVTLMVFLGVNFAWSSFATPTQGAGAR
jgi:hypothetical protein